MEGARGPVLVFCHYLRYRQPMSRPLHLEHPNAIYHVISRGNRRDAIFVDDEDRQRFLSILGQTLDRFQASVVAYCLMSKHYHLALHTQEPNLSALLRCFNGIVIQSNNRRNCKVGHLFQGRFKAKLLDQDAYLLGHAPQNLVDGDIPKQQRLADKSLTDWLDLGKNREHGLSWALFGT